MFAWTFSKLKRFAGTNCFLSFYQPDCLFVFVEKMSVVFLSLDHLIMEHFSRLRVVPQKVSVVDVIKLSLEEI